MVRSDASPQKQDWRRCCFSTFVSPFTTHANLIRNACVKKCKFGAWCCPSAPYLAVSGASKCSSSVASLTSCVAHVLLKLLCLNMKKHQNGINKNATIECIFNSRMKLTVRMKSVQTSSRADVESQVVLNSTARVCSFMQPKQNRLRSSHHRILKITLLTRTRYSLR